MSNNTYIKQLEKLNNKYRIKQLKIELEHKEMKKLLHDKYFKIETETDLKQYFIFTNNIKDRVSNKDLKNLMIDNNLQMTFKTLKIFLKSNGSLDYKAKSSRGMMKLQLRDH